MKVKPSPENFKLNKQLCFPLYAAARKVVASYTPLLKPIGITYTQYLVFLVLWEEDNITVGDLCKQLCLDSGTITPVLKKMEADGYITRTRNKDDERVVIVALTDKGKEVYDKVQHIPCHIGSCIDLTNEEADELYKLLYRVIEGY